METKPAIPSVNAQRIKPNASPVRAPIYGAKVIPTKPQQGGK